MRRIYFQAIIIALALIYCAPLHVFGQISGDFRSITSGDWEIETNWQIYNGVEWISAQSGQTPRLTNNVTIQNGHSITLKSTSECKSLHIQEGGILNIAGKSLYTYGNVQIMGRMKGSNLPNSSFGSWYIRGDYPDVQIDGILGGTQTGSDGEGVNIYMYHTSGSKLRFHGNGLVNISSLLVKSASANNYIVDIDIDMNLKNTYSANPALSLQNLTSGANSERVINILAGRKVVITDPSGCFHAVQSSGVNNSGGKMTYNVYGTLDVSAGNFNFSTNTISIKNQLTINVLTTGRLVLGPQVNLNLNLAGQFPPVLIFHQNAQLVFKGVTAPNIKCTAISGESLPVFPWSSLQNVSLDFSGQLLLSSHIYCRKLEIGKNAQLHFIPGNHITITDSLINNGKMIFESDHSGTASMLNPPMISGDGFYQFNQHVSSLRNWYITSPVSDALPTSSIEYFAYDEINALWSKIFYENAFTPMKGYIAQTGENNLLTFEGKKLNNQNLNIHLSRTSGSSYSGYNLIGNPYPCYLNIEKIIENETIEPTFWYRTKINEKYVFDTYNIASGISSSNSGKVVEQWIPPMQAFWIRIKPAYQNSIISFDSFTKGHRDNTNNSLRVLKNEKTPILRIKIDDGINSDESVVYFHEKASDEIDNFDSFKMSDNSFYPEIFSVINNEKLVINGLKLKKNLDNQSLDASEIKLGVKCKVNTPYTIQLNATEFTSDSIHQIVFRDNLLKLELPIYGKTNYDFISNIEDVKNRFIIQFKSADKVTQTKKIIIDESIDIHRIEMRDGVINIYSLNNDKKIFYDIHGRIIKNE